MMKDILYVGLGGGLGSVLRFLVGVWLPTSGKGFPTTTFLINIIVSWLIVVLMGYFQKNGQPAAMSLLLTTGFCGGFTTFSTFSKESFTLFQQQQWLILLSYVGLSVVGCIAATAFGFSLQR